MEIQDWEADQAIALMRAAEDDNLTTKQFYDRLQEWVAPRVLVDKSPSYALDALALRKAEADFDRPRYVHLVRHPGSMIDSFERHHMEQILYLKDHTYDPRRLAELVWTISHRTVTSFLDSVPEHRWHRVRFEDLVQDPAAEMLEICRALDLPFHTELADPYQNLERKMIDGVHPESAPMGDPGFLAHGRINPSTAAPPANSVSGELGDPTLQMAAALGYHLTPAGPNGSTGRARRDSLQRQRELRNRRPGASG